MTGESPRLTPEDVSMYLHEFLYGACMFGMFYIHISACWSVQFAPPRPTAGISVSVSHPKLRFLTCFSIASQSGPGVTRPHSTNTHNAKVRIINLAKQQNLIRFVQQSHESKASVILCVMNGRCCASVPDVCMCRCLPPPPTPPRCHNTCSRSGIVSPPHVLWFPLRQLHGAASTARRPRPRRRLMLRSGSYLQFIFIFFHTLIRILC